MWEFVVVFAIILLGAIVQGVSGFGLGLVAMGVLPLFLTIKESTLLVISLLVVAAATVVIKNAKHIEWKKVRSILIFALLGRIAAFFILSRYGDLNILKTWLGIFLILMVGYLLFQSVMKPEKKEPTLWIALMLGLLGGFIGGLFGVGGPFFVFYFLMVFATDKYKYLVNVQFVTLIVCLFSIVLHAVNGDFEPSFIGLFIAGTLAVMIGTFIGLRLFAKVNNEVIRKLAMFLVFISALNLILFS
ncbi:hypothetical protein JCM19037_987 [Geomicrobium sp. JCM 19037]|uniref:sulfite exporter TauE/SafE family protein n=1 Tax=Geomicrobium sp. JCM 19037 TaxID=1460634 RepID=UPI00045F3139|nr:sulfite exporter TauE/SafE family protein [Geomicrobium sp. JCM 19037]GAK02732.1 hypothetical protein JCM19037_987 [Geomicrobium sp. JCM 19037]